MKHEDLLAILIRDAEADLIRYEATVEEFTLNLNAAKFRLQNYREYLANLNALREERGRKGA